MTTNISVSEKHYVYAGLAGETAPGRMIKSGLYRMVVGNGGWEVATNGLPEAPEIRALAVHPQKPERVFAGTQDGPYRSDDHGDNWEKVNVADHGLPVWSFLFHPRDPNVMYAGYESSEIYRSDDGGESWSQLPVTVRFPEITMAPGANPAKRILMMAGSTFDPDTLYAAIEVGGLIRSLDGGEHWENMSHGLYMNDDIVDTHGVATSSLRPDTVFNIARAGLFRSADRGEHWLRVPIEAMNEKGQTYCRDIREVPGDPNTFWVAGGANFRSDQGALFRSSDGGMNWERVELDFQPASTVFSLAFDERHPTRMYCASSDGEVWGSQDSGSTWSNHRLPEGASQLYALACG